MDFNEKKKSYFLQLRAFCPEQQKVQELYKLGGLLDEGWGNVIDHNCLVAGRSLALGKILNLPGDVMDDLNVAGLLHDSGKRREIEENKADQRDGGTGRLAAVEANVRWTQVMRDYEINERVLWFTEGPGGQIHELNAKLKMFERGPEFMSAELAWIVLAYVDDFTIEDFYPVAPTSDGKNAVNYRMDANREKEAYRRADREVKKLLIGHPVFDGMTSFDAMTYCARRCEEILAQALKKRAGIVVPSLTIPELVDQHLAVEIEKIIPGYEAYFG